jgi:hypothetical protein
MLSLLARYRISANRIPLCSQFSTAYQIVQLANLNAQASKSKKATNKKTTKAAIEIWKKPSISSEPYLSQELAKGRKIVIGKLNIMLRGERPDHCWIHHRFPTAESITSELASKRAADIFNKLVELKSPLLLDFMCATPRHSTFFCTNEQYTLWMSHVWKFGGVKAIMKLYNKLQPMLLTRRRLPLLSMVHHTVLSAKYRCPVDVPEKLLLDILKLDKPRLRQLYPRLMFTLILRRCRRSTEIYMLVRQKVNTMGKAFYVNLLSCMTIQRAYELVLAQLLYEDLIKSGHILTEDAYVRLFAELLKDKQYGGPDSYKCISAKRRADFLYRLFFKQASSKIFPQPYLVGIFIQFLAELDRYSDAKKVYQLYMEHKSNQFAIDIAYVNVLLTRGKTKEADELYHRAFKYGFCRLKNGQYTCANGETIEYCRSEITRLIDPAFARQHQITIANASEYIRDHKLRQKLKRKYPWVLLDRPNKFSPILAKMSRTFCRKISWNMVTRTTRELVSAHYKAHDYQKLYKVYECFEMVGFYDVSVYRYTLLGLRDAGQYELMDKVFENMKKRHFMFISVIAALYIERLIAKDDLKAAEDTLHDYLRKRKHVKKYESNDVNMANPGYLFKVLISSYTKRGDMKKAHKLASLGYSLDYIDNRWLMLPKC